MPLFRALTGYSEDVMSKNKYADVPAFYKLMEDDKSKGEENEMEWIELDENSPLLSTFTTSSFALGLILGLFIQLSTLGANFVAMIIWGAEIVTKTNREILFFSLGWSSVTSILAVMMLSFLRSMVSVIFRSLLDYDDTDESEDALCDLLAYLESRFLTGVLVGLCLAWTVTDFLLGLQPQMMLSICTLLVAFLWCRLTVHISRSQRHSNSTIDDDEDELDTDLILII